MPMKLTIVTLVIAASAPLLATEADAWEYRSNGDTYACTYAHDYDTVSALFDAGERDSAAEYFQGERPTCMAFREGVRLITVTEIGNLSEVIYINEGVKFQGWTSTMPLENAAYHLYVGQKKADAIGKKFVTGRDGAYGCANLESLNSMMTSTSNGMMERHSFQQCPEMDNGNCAEVPAGVALIGVRKSDNEYQDQYLVKFQYGDDRLEFWVSSFQVQEAR